MTDDLIRRKDAIDAMMDLKQEDDEAYGCEIPEGFDGQRAVEALEKLPSAEPEPKWIPVTEALPEEKEIVLITNNKGHVRCGQYQGTFDDKNYRWWWKHNTLEKVLAWMPLPEPWEGEA